MLKRIVYRTAAAALLFLALSGCGAGNGSVQPETSAATDASAAVSTAGAAVPSNSGPTTGSPIPSVPPVSSSDAGSGPLSEEEIERFNQMLETIKTGPYGEILLQPVSCFFTSEYDDVRKLDFSEFLRQFPYTDIAGDDEFEALKQLDNWPFSKNETRENMPVPVHRIDVAKIDKVLTDCAGITVADLRSFDPEFDRDVCFLASENAYYNFTSDYGPGMFIAERGERKGRTVTLYSVPHGLGEVYILVLKQADDGYLIESHQRWE